MDEEMQNMDEEMDTKKVKGLEQYKRLIYQSIDVDFDENYESWILEPLVPFEAITVLDGLGGSGKSWFAMDLSYSIGQGVDFLGKYPVKRSGTVLYITAEEVPQMFLKRVKLITMSYGDNENFYWLSTLHKDFPFGSALLHKTNLGIIRTDTARLIEYFIREYKPILIILDSMINFYGLNENDSSEAIVFYELIKEWIKTYSCSFLLLHHQTKEAIKSREEDGVFRGSIVFREQARERLTYRNIKLENGMIARKISIEKANYYSPLLEGFPIHLRWTEGTHVYDEEVEKQVKKQEENKKSFKGEKKNKQEEEKKEEKKEEKEEEKTDLLDSNF